MRFLRVWYVIQNKRVWLLKSGSIGEGVYAEPNISVIQEHLSMAYPPTFLSEKEWTGQVKKDYLILDTRFRQIVTEDYLGEWDEVFEL